MDILRARLLLERIANLHPTVERIGDGMLKYIIIEAQEALKPKIIISLGEKIIMKQVILTDEE